MDAMKAAMAAAQGGRRSPDPEARRRSAGVLHCVLRALGRWPEHEGMSTGVLHCVLRALGRWPEHEGMSTNPREEEALARALADAASRLAARGSCVFFRGALGRAGPYA